MAEVKEDEMPSRRERVLSTLMKLYQESERSITLREMVNATRLGRDIIRRELEVLKCLGLIESRQGMKGGYTPTIHAYGGIICLN